MHQFKLCRGIRFTTNDGRILTIERRTITNLYQLVDEQGAIESVSRHVLLDRWRKHEWVLDPSSIPKQSDIIYNVTPRDLASYTQDQQQIARDRFEFIKPFIESRKTTNAQIKDHCAKTTTRGISTPSLRSVQRWLARYRCSRDMTALIPCQPRRRPTVRQEFETILEESINETFLKPERPPKKDVIDEIIRKIEAFNETVSEGRRIILPSRSTLFRRLRDLCAFAADSKRFGSDEARRRNRHAIQIIKTQQILERVELDHTKVDLIVIDPKTNVILGRPWLTVVIDHHSRMVLGYYLSFDAPNAYSVLHALVHAVLPKTYLRTRYPDIKNEWPAMGLPITIVVDNGMELHGSRIQEFCVETSSSLQFCPRVTPWFKPIVERFNRSLNTGLIHTLPGTTFGSAKERGKYASEERACIDIETLEHLFVRWVVDEYHVRPHRTLRASPLEVWNRSMKRDGVALPASPADLQLLLGASVKRRVHHYGIEMDTVHYNSHELQDLYRRLSRYGASNHRYPVVELRYYDLIGFIDVYDPDNKTYLRVPARDIEYAEALTRATHKLLTKVTQQQFGERWRSSDRLEVKNKAQEQVKEAQQRKKANTRAARAAANVARSSGHSSDRISQTKPIALDMTTMTTDDVFDSFEPIAAPPSHSINAQGTHHAH